MKKQRFVWSILPGLFLLIGVVAGYGSGCSGNNVGGDNVDAGTDPNAADDMSTDPNAASCAAVNANCGLGGAPDSSTGSI
ncbi:MAG TPA: hypothetical protein PK493_00670, partial [Pseudomonadota bacterium]|nr:hypothetical protein [Pseudomonadota bacterium]